MINWRIYTALFYLSKGNTKAFNELCCKDISEELYNNSCQVLSDKGYINKKGTLIYITPLGLELVQNKNNDVKKVDSTKWVDEFRKKFPANRMEKKEIVIEELNKFMKDNEIDSDTILKATEEYMNKQRKENFMYCLKSTNFIQKDLKTYCEFIKFNPNCGEISTITGKMLG